jgi:hypothetical protein
VGLANLQHSLKAGAAAETLGLKLTKKGNAPYLSVEAQTVDGGLNVVQDVPVRVLSAPELGRYSEPQIPEPQVRPMATRAVRCECWGEDQPQASLRSHKRPAAPLTLPRRAMLTPSPLPAAAPSHPQARLTVPSCRSMSAVVERMKALGSKALALCADTRVHELTLAAATDAAAIKTYYRGLQPEDHDPNAAGEGESRSRWGRMARCQRVEWAEFLPGASGKGGSINFSQQGEGKIRAGNSLRPSQIWRPAARWHSTSTSGTPSRSSARCPSSPCRRSCVRKSGVDGGAMTLDW